MHGLNDNKLAVYDAS